MPTYTQKTLEQYFEEHGIREAQEKARLLPQITDLIYDRNMHVVKWEAETDPYKRAQIEEGMEDLESEIASVFTHESKTL